MNKKTQFHWKYRCCYQKDFSVKIRQDSFMTITVGQLSMEVFLSYSLSLRRRGDTWLEVISSPLIPRQGLPLWVLLFGLASHRVEIYYTSLLACLPVPFVRTLCVGFDHIWHRMEISNLKLPRV